MASVGLQSRPLPPEPTTYEIWREDRPQYLVAYNLAFNAEKYATQHAEAEPTNEVKDNIISARVDGYLLVELFNRRAILTEGPCIYISKELRSEDREGGDANDTVFKVGNFYRDRFLRLFRTTTTAYPSPSLHLSRPSFDTVLARDGYRCILTGNFDDKSMNKDRELNEMRGHLGAGIATESRMQSVDPTGGSGDSRVMDKTQNDPHSLGILLSLNPIYHNYFDGLNL
ncbi:hypothetical protein EI94DRAFT_1750815 [Lactarius quietus]|nr:hypothetical protein EI94DRAFT_1750815 [Lactarius quietus]